MGVDIMAEKSRKPGNPELAEAINRLADAVECLRMDLHSYFSEEMPTRRVHHGNDI
jgi:hypothetical protein